MGGFNLTFCWGLWNLFMRDIGLWCLMCLPTFFFFCGTKAWTQGLHPEPLHQPFFLWWIFFKIGFHWLFVWASNVILLRSSASWVARIIGMRHQGPACLLFCLLFFFCSAGVWTQSLVLVSPPLEPLHQLKKLVSWLFSFFPFFFLSFKTGVWIYFFSNL
jgi:hypothetical protein